MGENSKCKGPGAVTISESSRKLEKVTWLEEHREVGVEGKGPRSVPGGREQLAQGLVNSDLEFKFYFKSNMKPLEDFKQDRGIAQFAY